MVWVWSAAGIHGSPENLLSGSRFSNCSWSWSGLLIYSSWSELVLDFLYFPGSGPVRDQPVLVRRSPISSRPTRNREARSDKTDSSVWKGVFYKEILGKNSWSQRTFSFNNLRMKNNSRNWVFKIFGDFGRFWWIGWSADDIYIFIIENNLKKIRKFLDPKLINLTIGITSVFSTLIPVIFLNSSESILKYTGIGRHKNGMIFTYDGIWGLSLKFLGNIKKGLRVGPLGLWIFGKRFIAYFLPKCTWTSDFKKRQLI